MKSIKFGMLMHTRRQIPRPLHFYSASSVSLKCRNLLGQIPCFPGAKIPLGSRASCTGVITEWSE